LREPRAEGLEAAEARFLAEARSNLPRNYGAHLVHGLLGQTGFRLIHAPTFVPAYVFLLSGSDLAVGIARSLQSLGMFLSPILGATAIEHRRRVLPVGFAVGAAMRVQLLGLAIVGFALGPRLALPAVWLFLGLFGFFLGMQGVVFNFLVSKVIPVERRGLLMGLRNTLSGITAAGVGVLGGSLVGRNVLGNGYAATFLLAFGLTALGLVALLFVREPESPRVREPAGVGERLRELPPLLRRDRAFTWYFLARALGTMGRMGVPFYYLYARTRIELTGDDLGLLTAAFVLGQTATTLLWGAAADRLGFRATFAVSLALWMGTAIALLVTSSLGVLTGVFTCLGAGLGGFMLSGQNLVLEFGSREELPLRIAVANSATELVGAVGPLLGGALAALGSYEAVFTTAVGVQAVALGIVWLAVPEPRRR
jgi:MFS family permease